MSHHSETHCNTPQHTATRCNTLQHTATHCNTLQHTATHCSTPHHIVAHCNALHRCNNTLQHTSTHSIFHYVECTDTNTRTHSMYISLYSEDRRNPPPSREGLLCGCFPNEEPGERVEKISKKIEIYQFWGLYVRKSDPLPLNSLFGNHPGGVVFGRRPPRGGLHPKITPPVGAILFLQALCLEITQKGEPPGGGGGGGSFDQSAHTP